jgi:hypothetical protein
MMLVAQKSGWGSIQTQSGCDEVQTQGLPFYVRSDDQDAQQGTYRDSNKAT